MLHRVWKVKGNYLWRLLYYYLIYLFFFCFFVFEIWVSFMENFGVFSNFCWRPAARQTPDASIAQMTVFKVHYPARDSQMYVFWHIIPPIRLRWAISTAIFPPVCWRELPRFSKWLDRCQYNCCVAVDSLSAIFDSKIKHEWHIKTHCYTLKNKQRINKLSTNDYVICK